MTRVGMGIKKNNNNEEINKNEQSLDRHRIKKVI